ncbi:hypothetical protein QT711_03185 [Sporosarcina saromensis]|uniref:Uncharacterized protein n=1 Tax=Sporosarcina saromensis TaxID=359365 RepID=A0ABU4G5C6_9BACL|nr:hypothetical protein [Sporosarcina saromensis]MDW0112174.1 hypothetical protein [Sporosarcina saromensis]
MLIAYQILLILLIVLFGILAFGATDEKLKDRSAKLTAMGMISLLITFWLF